MKNEIQIIPIEVSEIANRVSQSKQEELKVILNQIFAGTDDWERQVDEIEVKDINDKLSIEMANVARKNAKEARLNAEKIFDAKRAEVQAAKVEFDTEDKLWLKAKQIMQIKFKAIEEKAEYKADFVRRYEQQQKELRTQKRIIEVSKYGEINRVEFENMTDPNFKTFLAGLKASHEEKILAEEKRKAEEVAAKMEELEAIKRREAENARLKAELAEKQAELDRISQENMASNILIGTTEDTNTWLHMAYSNEVMVDLSNTPKFVSSELNSEFNTNTVTAKIMRDWVNSFGLPVSYIKSPVKDDIIDKFNKFKVWALTEISKSEQ